MHVLFSGEAGPLKITLENSNTKMYCFLNWLKKTFLQLKSYSSTSKKEKGCCFPVESLSYRITIIESSDTEYWSFYIIMTLSFFCISCAFAIFRRSRYPKDNTWKLKYKNVLFLKLAKKNISSTQKLFKHVKKKKGFTNIGGSQYPKNRTPKFIYKTV